MFTMYIFFFFSFSRYRPFSVSLRRLLPLPAETTRAGQ